MAAGIKIIDYDDSRRRRGENRGRTEERSRRKGERRRQQQNNPATAEGMKRSNQFAEEVGLAGSGFGVLQQLPSS